MKLVPFIKPGSIIGKNGTVRLLRWNTPTRSKPQGELIVMLRSGQLAKADPAVYGMAFEA